jgi:hypothetical protein
VRIDHTHRKWLGASLIILGASTAMYVPYAVRAPSGPRGGSPLGLTFGIIGSAFMIFAGLLAGRKKFPIWRLGRAQSWMRGHLWLGLLSLPIIFFHAGFRFGGSLTTVLMVLVITVVGSGVFGALLQHSMPNMMTTQVPSETIFEQIQHVRDQLVAQADETTATAESASTAEQSAAPLVDFYRREMRPFLESRGKKHQLLSNPDRSRSTFEGLRMLLPLGLQDAATRLEQICEEERQLRRQSLLHHWLHGWLMLHIPLSFALLLLGVVHAITALRY